MLNKKLKARRRAAKTRIRIRESGKPRLCVYRSNKHLYTQLIISNIGGDKVLASASTLDAEFKEKGSVSNNIQTASLLGKIIGKKVLDCNIQKVAFDRSGHRYHGGIKALADAAREIGLEF